MKLLHNHPRISNRAIGAARRTSVGISLLFFLMAMPTLKSATPSDQSSGSGPVVSLTGGPITVDLPISGTFEIISLTNDTGKDIYDLELSTVLSSWDVPDFEGGDVVVRSAGNDLGWSTNKAPADGVEEIKTMAPGIGTVHSIPSSSIVKKGSAFTVEFWCTDGFSSGDKITITPTTLKVKGFINRGVQICSTFGGGHLPTNIYKFFNGYDGLPGEHSGSWEGFNNQPQPVESVTFDSTSTGVYPTFAQSSHPHTFDPLTYTLEFNPPIPAGSAFDYDFDLNTTDPFVSGDPDPFTEILVSLNLGNDFGLSVAGLVAGGTATFSMSQATPNGVLALAYSLSGGGPTVISVGSCSGLVLDLSAPFSLMAMLTPDANGDANLSMGIPIIASGISVWIQALDLPSCTTSNQVATVIL